MAAVEPTTVPLQPPLRDGTFASLRDRDFRWLWISTVAMGFGQWGQQIALGWLVYELTGSAVQLGAVTFAGGVIALVLTPFAGLLADRYSRRSVMLISSILAAGLAAAVAVLVVAGLAQVWHAYVFAVLTAVLQAANQPARQAYVHDIAGPGRLANAIALNSIAQNVARIAGPPLTGLIAGWSVGAAFLFVAGVKGFGALATLLLTNRPQEWTVTTRNPLLQIVDGFAYLLREPRLRILLAVNAVPALLVYPYMTIMPVFASEVFDSGASSYGWLVASIAVGSVIGLLGLARLGDIQRKTQVMMGCFVVYMLLLLTFTRMESLLVALALLVIAGMFHGVALALNNTVFQTELRPDMRGRGMAALQIGFGLFPLGGLPMGLMVRHFGVQDGVALEFALALAFFVGLALFGRSLMRSPAAQAAEPAPSR